MSTPSAKPDRSFAGWVPIHIHGNRPQPTVLWSHLGGQRFDDPFFVHTVTRAFYTPLAKLLQRTTSLDELAAAAEREPSVEPAGFIFHVSRCGSTLVSQMFARLPRIISVSEPQPLMVASDDPHLSQMDRQRAFRALIRLYGRKVSGSETASVFKFGMRELFQWRAISEMFPHVPRIVLHRDPIEVLVSNVREIAELTMPGNLPADALGEPPQPLTSHEDYAAFVLSRIYAFAADLARSPGTLTIAYTDLPHAVESRIAPHFGITLDDADRTAMREATRLYAKDPDRFVEFQPDTAEKQAGTSAPARAWCASFIEPFHAQLRSL